MSIRKIAKCINVRINVGNYQHIELIDSCEESIEFNTEAERVEKENQLSNDLIASLLRTIKDIPERIGKGTSEVNAVQESIKSKLPDWLANNAVPNIAKQVDKKVIQVTAEQKDKKDTVDKNIKDALAPQNEVRKTPPTSPTSPTPPVVNKRETEVVTDADIKVVKQEIKTSIDTVSNSKDLFEDDDDKVEVKPLITTKDSDLFDDPTPTPTPTPTPVATVKEVKKTVTPKKDDDFINFDDDDDIFK